MVGGHSFLKTGSLAHVEENSRILILRLRGGDDEMADEVAIPATETKKKRRGKRAIEPPSEAEIARMRAQADADLTAEERLELQNSKIVVPSERYPTVLSALAHARAPEERGDGNVLDMADEEGESIFIKRGVYNISSAPELTLVRAVAVSGQAGAVLAAYAHPRKDKLYPEIGGGRLRVEEEASGSVLRGVEWWSDNVQCVVVEGAAVLFAGCTFKCRAHAYVSAVWAGEGAHLSMVNCTVGGFDKKQLATCGVVVDASSATLQDCVLHYCDGATVAVEGNGTAKITQSRLLDSYSGVCVSDGRLYEEGGRVPATVEIRNCTVKCVNGLWRDDDRPVTLSVSELVEQEQDYPEFAHLVDIPYPYPEVAFNAERGEWEYAGVSAETRQRQEDYFNKYKGQGEVDLAAVHRQLRSERVAAEWESSDDPAPPPANLTLFGPAHTEQLADVTSFDVRQRHHSLALRDIRPRYLNGHGHEGLAPRIRNRHFAGVQKHPRVKRPGRHVYKRS